MLVEKKFTRLELINAIEKAHGKEVNGLEIYYPSDPRCLHRLWVELWLEGQERYQSSVNYAEDEVSIHRVFNNKVKPVSWHWDCYGDVVLSGVFRVADGFDF